MQLIFKYVARTPDVKAKLALSVGTSLRGAEFQIDSMHSGWTSGRMPLRDGVITELPLAKPGENVFKVFCLVLRVHR